MGNIQPERMGGDAHLAHAVALRAQREAIGLESLLVLIHAQPTHVGL